MARHGVTEFLRIFSADESIFVSIETDLLIVLDDSGNIIRVNPAFEKLLGRYESDVLRHGIINYVHPDDVAVFLHAFEPERNTKPFRLLKFEHGDLWVRLIAKKFARNEEGQRGYLVLRPESEKASGPEWQRRANWSG